MMNNHHLTTCTSVDNSDIELEKHILEESQKVEVERKQAELELLQTAIQKRLTTAGSPISTSRKKKKQQHTTVAVVVEEEEVVENDESSNDNLSQQPRQQQQQTVKPFFKNLRPSSSTNSIQPPSLPPQKEQERQQPQGRYQLRKTGFWDEQKQGKQKKTTMEVKWNHPARAGTAPSTTTTTSSNIATRSSSFSSVPKTSSFKTTTATTTTTSSFRTKKIGSNNTFVRQSQLLDHQRTKEESKLKRQAMEQKWMRKSQQQQQQTRQQQQHQQHYQDYNDNDDAVSESQQTDIIKNHHHHFPSSPKRRSNTKDCGDDEKVMLVLLSSTIIGHNRNQRMYQDRVVMWLSQRRHQQQRDGGIVQEKIPLETVDASSQPLRRNQLLAASGKGPSYPQLFLQQGETLTFVGDYDTLYQLNETGRLADEYFLSLLPAQNSSSEINNKSTTNTNSNMGRPSFQSSFKSKKQFAVPQQKQQEQKKIPNYNTRTKTSWTKPKEISQGLSSPATKDTTNQPRRVTNYWQQQQSQEESKHKRKSLAAKWESRHQQQQQQQHVVVEPPTVPRVSTGSSWGPQQSNYMQEEKKETEFLDKRISSTNIPESENLPKANKPRRVTGYWEQRRSSKGGEGGLREENNSSSKNLIKSEEEPKQDAQPTTLEIKRMRLQEKRQEYQQLKLDASRRLEQEIGLMIGMEKKEAAKEKTKQLVGMYQDLEKSHAKSKIRETTALDAFRKKKNEPARSQMSAWKEKELHRRNAEFQKQKYQSRIPRYHHRYHQEESSSTAWPDCPSDARTSDLLSPSQRYYGDDDMASNDSVPDQEISKGHVLRKAWHKRASKVIENLEGIKEEKKNHRGLQHSAI